MREAPEYRAVLEQLMSAFGKGWVSVSEIARYDQCDPRTARKRYRIGKGAGGLDISILAARRCEAAK